MTAQTETNSSKDLSKLILLLYYSCESFTFFLVLSNFLSGLQESASMPFKSRTRAMLLCVVCCALCLACLFFLTMLLYVAWSSLGPRSTFALGSWMDLQSLPEKLNEVTFFLGPGGVGSRALGL